MAEVVFMTSGSSGEPKKIVRSEERLQADARDLAKLFPEVWDGEPPVVASVPTDHLYGALWRVRVPQVARARVDERTALSLEDLTDAYSRLGKFVFITTPSFVEKLLTHPDVALLKDAFRAIVTSGGPMRGETARKAKALFGTTPLEIYGSTEVGSVAYRRQKTDDICTLVPTVSASLDEEGRLVVDSPYAEAGRFVMSDAAEFIDNRRFRLLGRTDRRVKILENLVSLTSVEQVLERHPLIERARVEAVGEEVPRLGALIVLNAEGRKALAEATHGEIGARLRRELKDVISAGEFPRRLRFVRELPVDDRGKTTSKLAKDALAAWCKEPVVEAWQVSADALTAEFVFPPDCECFDGHFPTFKVLPGVAQLYFVRHFARQAFRDFPLTCSYRRLKFQKLVLPRERVQLVVKRTGEGVFSFSLTAGEKAASSGTIEGEKA